MCRQTSVGDEVTGVISKLFHCTDNTSVSLESMQKQDSRSNNCGVFAIAAATAIVNSYNPSLLHFKEKEMWKHHCDHFENGIITTFHVTNMMHDSWSDVDVATYVATW